MEMLLPEWAPNIHPLIIHFPIALWLVAILFDGLSIFRSKGWVRNTTISLYALGALSALAAYLSGEQAIDQVTIPMQGELTASNHSDWGHYTFYFFAIYAAIRIYLFWIGLDTRRWLAIILFTLGVVGMGIVGKTADFGAKLVYKYGVGTQK